MMQNPEQFWRRSIRLKGFNYSQAGAYFLTICARDRQSLFGEILNGQIILNSFGKLVQTEWLRTAVLRPTAILDYFAVMPNHFHGIIFLTSAIGANSGTARRAPTEERFGNPVSGSLPTIIRSFKSAVTRGINERSNSFRIPIWQRNYYEHSIRNDDELNRIRQYIIDNPLNWEVDRENPNAASLKAKESWEI